MSLALGPARTQQSRYDEDAGEIRYTIVQVVLVASCPVCDLTLPDTPEVVAAGLSRLVQSELSEDRYEGWRDAVSDSELDDIMREMALGEEYGNE